MGQPFSQSDTFLCTATTTFLCLVRDENAKREEEIDFLEDFCIELTTEAGLETHCRAVLRGKEVDGNVTKLIVSAV